MCILRNIPFVEGTCGSFAWQLWYLTGLQVFNHSCERSLLCRLGGGWLLLWSGSKSSLVVGCRASRFTSGRTSTKLGRASHPKQSPRSRRTLPPSCTPLEQQVLPVHLVNPSQPRPGLFLELNMPNKAYILHHHLRLHCRAACWFDMGTMHAPVAWQRIVHLPKCAAQLSNSPEMVHDHIIAWHVHFLKR